MQRMMNLIIVFLCYTMYKINHMNLIIVFLYWKQKKSEIYEKWKFSKTVGNMIRRKFEVSEKWYNQYHISDSKTVGNMIRRKIVTPPTQYRDGNLQPTPFSNPGKLWKGKRGKFVGPTPPPHSRTLNSGKGDPSPNLSPSPTPLLGKEMERERKREEEREREREEKREGRYCR